MVQNFQVVRCRCTRLIFEVEQSSGSRSRRGMPARDMLVRQVIRLECVEAPSTPRSLKASVRIRSALVLPICVLESSLGEKARGNLRRARPGRSIHDSAPLLWASKT